MLREIFRNFGRLRDTSQDAAYRDLHKGLSDNADLLIATEIMDMPKLLDSLTKIEEFIKSRGDTEGKTAAEAIHDWLNDSSPTATEAKSA